MAAIILGKNLMTEDELIEFAFSPENLAEQTITELRSQACDAAILSSLMLIRMMKADRIYITRRPSET